MPRDGFRGEAELLAGVQSEDMRIVMPNGWWDCVCFTSSREDVLAFQTKHDYNTSQVQGCLIQRRVE